MAAGGDTQGGFQYQVRRIQDFSGDHPRNLTVDADPNRKWLFVQVRLNGLRVFDRGAYFDQQSFRANQHGEIHNLLSLSGVPVSSGSDRDLLGSLVTDMLITAESGGGEEEMTDCGIIPLLVEITSTEAVQVEEKVYNCILCEKDIVDEEGEEPECGHIFHQDSIFDWLQENDTCPACGYEIDMDR